MLYKKSFQEYRRKGLVSNSATFSCQSIHHNDGNEYERYKEKILDLRNIVESFKLSHQAELNDDNQYYTMVSKLRRLQMAHTPTVWFPATMCDSIAECWNGEDEKNCGFTLEQTIGIIFLYLILILS